MTFCFALDSHAFLRRECERREEAGLPTTREQCWQLLRVDVTDLGPYSADRGARVLSARVSPRPTLLAGAFTFLCADRSNFEVCFLPSTIMPTRKFTFLCEESPLDHGAAVDASWALNRSRFNCHLLLKGLSVSVVFATLDHPMDRSVCQNRSFAARLDSCRIGLWPTLHSRAIIACMQSVFSQLQNLLELAASTLRASKCGQ